MLSEHLILVFNILFTIIDIVNVVVIFNLFSFPFFVIVNALVIRIVIINILPK